MADGRFEYSIGFKTDESGLKQAKQALQEIMNMSAKSGSLNDAGVQQYNQELREAKEAASQLEAALSKAYNVKMGNTDVRKLNQELTLLGQGGLQEIYQKMSKIGPAGEAAFNKTALAAMKAGTEIKQGNALLDKFGKTLMRNLEWLISGNIINSITGVFTKAFGYTKNLDDSLNNIRVVTSKGADEMARFGKEAQETAMKLGKGTTDITNASLIFYQQGLEKEQVDARTEIAVKLANVSGQSTEQAADNLTALWNGFEAGIDDLERYADVMTAVAASTASSSQELSASIAKVASVANTTGVDMEQLTSMLSTVIATTRQSPETVGTAFKTIFARINDLVEDGTDEFGVSLGRVSSHLKAMGIDILDSEGNLIELGDTFDTIGEKWATYTEEQKIALAEQIGGKKQWTMAMALFDHWDEYKDTLDTAHNAAGSLQEQQDITMDKLTTHIQQVKTAWEGVYSELMNPDDLIPIVDTVRNILEHVESLIKALGGIKPILTMVSGLMMRAFSDKIAQNIMRMSQNFKVQNSAKLVEDAQAQVREKFAKSGSEVAQRMATKYGEMAKYTSSMTKDQKELFDKTMEEQRVLEEKSKELKDQLATEEKRYSKYKAFVNDTKDKKGGASDIQQDTFNKVKDANTSLQQGKIQTGTGEVGLSLDTLKEQKDAVDAIKQAENNLNNEMTYGGQILNDRLSTLENINNTGGVSLSEEQRARNEEEINTIKELQKAQESLRTTLKDMEQQEKEKGTIDEATLQTYENQRKKIVQLTEALRQSSTEYKTLSPAVMSIRDLLEKPITADNVQSQIKDIRLNLIEMRKNGTLTREQFNEASKAYRDLSNSIKNGDLDIDGQLDVEAVRKKMEEIKNTVVEKAKEEASDLNQVARDMTAGTAVRAQSAEGAAGANEEEADQQLQHARRQQQVQDMTDIVAATTSLISVYQQFQNLGSIWKNEDTSLGEKFGQTIAAIGSMIPLLTISITKLASVYGSVMGMEAADLTLKTFLSQKLTELTVKQIALNVAMGALAGVGIILALDQILKNIGMTTEALGKLETVVGGVAMAVAVGITLVNGALSTGVIGLFLAGAAAALKGITHLIGDAKIEEAEAMKAAQEAAQKHTEELKEQKKAIDDVCDSNWNLLKSLAAVHEAWQTFLENPEKIEETAKALESAGEALGLMGNDEKSEQFQGYLASGDLQGAKDMIDEAEKEAREKAVADEEEQLNSERNIIADKIRNQGSIGVRSGLNEEDFSKYQEVAKNYKYNTDALVLENGTAKIDFSKFSEEEMGELISEEGQKKLLANIESATTDAEREYFEALYKGLYEINGNDEEIKNYQAKAANGGIAKNAKETFKYDPNEKDQYIDATGEFDEKKYALAKHDEIKKFAKEQGVTYQQALSEFVKWNPDEADIAKDVSNVIEVTGKALNEGLAKVQIPGVDNLAFSDEALLAIDEKAKKFGLTMEEITGLAETNPELLRKLAREGADVTESTIKEIEDFVHAEQKATILANTDFENMSTELEKYQEQLKKHKVSAADLADKKEFQELKEQADAIKGLFPGDEEYKEALEVLDDENASAEDLAKALGVIDKRAKEGALERSFLAADEAAQDFKNSVKKIDKETEVLANNSGFVDFQEKVQNFLDADHELQITIDQKLDEEFDKIVEKLDKIDDASSKIGKNFIVSADDLTALGEAFPGILDGMTTLADGSIQLSQASVAEAKAAAKEEIAAEYDKLITKLDAEDTLLQIKEENYESMLQIAIKMKNGEYDTEKDYNDAVDALNKSMAEVQAANQMQVKLAEGKIADEKLKQWNKYYEKLSAEDAAFAQHRMDLLQAANGEELEESQQEYLKNHGINANDLDYTKTDDVKNYYDTYKVDPGDKDWKKTMQQNGETLYESITSSLADVRKRRGSLATKRMNAQQAKRTALEEIDHWGQGNKETRDEEAKKRQEELEKRAGRSDLTNSNEIDEYAEINEKIEELEEKRQDLIDDAQYLEGDELRQNVQSQIDLADDLIAAHEEKLQKKKDELHNQKESLISAGFGFDEDGKVIGLQAALSEIDRDIAAFEERTNSAKIALGDAEWEAAEAQHSAMLQRREDLKKLAEDYAANREDVIAEETDINELNLERTELKDLIGKSDEEILKYLRQQQSKLMDILTALDGVYDVYFSINQQLDDTKEKLEDLKKVQSHLTGQALVDNLKEQNELLKQQQTLNEDLIDTTETELALRHTQLQNEGLVIDENGMISNYDEVLKDRQAKINKAVGEYNKAQKEFDQKQDEMSEDGKERARQRVENLKTEAENLKSEAEQLNNDIKTYQDTRKKLHDTIVEQEELVRQQIANDIESVKVQLDVKISKQSKEDAERELKKVFADLKEDDLLGNAVFDMADLASEQNKLQAYQDSLAELQATKEKYMSGDYAYTEEELKEVLDQIDEVEGNIRESMKNIFNQQKALKEYMIKAYDQVGEKIEEEIGKFSKISDILNHDMNLIKLVYGEQSYDKISALYAKQTEMSKQQLNLAILKSEELHRNFLQAQQQGDEELIKHTQEAWIEAEGAKREAMENTIQAMKDEYTNAINEIFQYWDKQLTDGKGLNLIQYEWDAMKQKSEKYLDTVNGVYEIEKLRNQMQKAVDDTDDPATKKAINKLMNEEIEMLRNKDKLSKYDLDRAQALFDIEQKRAAFREAQDNKSKMRLRRDASGNYSYQFVSDEEKISSAMQDLTDAQNKLYNLDTDQYKSNLENVTKIYQDWQNEMAELGELDNEEKIAKAEAIQEKYAELMENALRDYGESRENYASSLLASMNQNIETMSDKEIEAILNQEGLWKNSMTDLAENLQDFNTISDDVISKAISKSKEYTDSLAEMEKQANLSFDAIAESADPVVNAIETMITPAEQLTAELHKTVEEVAKLVAILGGSPSSLSEVINGLDFNLQDTILPFITGISDLQNMFGINNITSTSQSQEVTPSQNQQNIQTVNQNTNNAATAGGGSTGAKTSNNTNVTPAAQNVKGEKIEQSQNSDWGVDEFPKPGDILTYLGGIYYENSLGQGRTGNRGPGGQVEVVKVVPDAPYPIAVRSGPGTGAANESAYGWLRRDQLSKKANVSNTPPVMKKSSESSGGVSSTPTTDTMQQRVATLGERFKNMKDFVEDYKMEFLKLLEQATLEDSVGRLREKTQAIEDKSKEYEEKSNNKMAMLLEDIRNTLESNGEYSREIHVDANFPGITSAIELERALREFENYATQVNGKLNR